MTSRGSCSSSAFSSSCELQLPPHKHSFTLKAYSQGMSALKTFIFTNKSFLKACLPLYFKRIQNKGTIRHEACLPSHSRVGVHEFKSRCWAAQFSRLLCVWSHRTFTNSSYISKEFNSRGVTTSLCQPFESTERLRTSVAYDGFIKATEWLARTSSVQRIVHHSVYQETMELFHVPEPHSSPALVCEENGARALEYRTPEKLWPIQLFRTGFFAC